MPGVLIASDKQYHETPGKPDVPCAAALLKLW